MKLIKTPLKDLVILLPTRVNDERGFFLESFQEKKYQEILNSNVIFVQDNLSHSKKNVLRGLHYQLQQPQDKLVTVIKGRVFDVAVDIRCNSPTFGKWHGVILDDENHHQFFIPKGFAHGFFVLSESADFHYKCSNYYNPSEEHGILWSDADLAIAWPEKKALLSETDKLYPCLKHIPPEHLFNY
ncbi:MAG: dTDP-4-dehydrorhamnose 3,5-epimerase [Rickettsia endosymbiont of Ixodes persulcatus]|nr:dTDP-4-dehydrorhamnose 3,5-epimerase [Rickettsia endosymbiont of Ixodes persulcatus]